MRIGLLITSIGNFGQKGFYNAQEIGLAKELDRLFVIGCTGALLYITFARILCKITYVKKVLCCTGRKTLPILAFHVFIFMVWDTIQERVLQKMGTTSLNGILYWSAGILKIAVTVMICIAGSWCWNTLKEKMKGKKDYGAKTI